MPPVPRWFGGPLAVPSARPLLWWIFASAAAGVGAFAVATVAVPDYSTFWDSWVYYGSVALLIGVMAVGAHLRAERQAFWLFVAVANAFFLAGSALFNFHEINLPTEPVPSPSDALYGLGYLLLYGALVHITRRQGSVLRSAWLDGLIVGLGMAAFVSIAVLHPLIENAGRTPIETAVAMAYPIADLLLMTFVAATLFRFGGRVGWSGGALTAGLLVYSLSDAAYFYVVETDRYVVGTILDSGWALGQLLMCAAVWLPDRRVRRVNRVRSVPGPGIVLPATFSFLALGVIVASVVTEVPGPAVLFAVATLALATVRTVLTIEELRRLHGSHELARTDDLTGFPNRRRLLEELEASLGRNEPTSMLLIDLDGFKEVNDSLGHEAGDEMLRLVARRLADSVPAGAAFARLGGDEFGAVVVGPPEAARHVASAMLVRLTEPFDLSGQPIEVSASIGVATCGPGATVPELLRSADIAMYRAKRAGTGVVLADFDGRRPT